MAQGDAEFLRDQVNRLSSLLARYQEAYPNFALQEYGLSEDEVKNQPWLTDKGEVAPLLREYDAIIYGLQGQLATVEDEFERLKKQSRDLVLENERLHQELKDSVHSQLSPDQVRAGGEGEVADDVLLHNLQQQIDLSIQEKEAAQERWREAAQEVDRLEAELEMEKDSHQWRVVEQQAHQVKEQYQQSVTALNSELDVLHNDLRDCRTENSNLSQKVSELKLTISDLQQQLIWKAQENADTIFKEGLSDSKISELKRIMDELRQRLSDVTKDASEMRRENTTFHTRVTELQRRLTDTELRENDAITQVREAVQMVESAVMEKDQAEVSARQREEELEEMKAVVAKLINKAGARTREEVDVVRKQCNERITQLTEELHALEMEGAEKQSRLDRLLREKRAVESELQQIYKEGLVEGAQSKEAYQELNKRAIEAERARDTARVKVDNLQAELDKLTMENQQLKQQMNSEVKQLQERLSSVQAEFETVSEDRVTSMNKLNDLNKKLVAAQQEKEAAHRKFTKELALIEQDQHVKTRDMEVKLQSTEDSRRQTVSELRRLLTAQQRMCARWKEECQTITHKFEGKMEDMRGELTHVKKRNEELTSLLKDSQAKTAEVQRMLSEYTKNIHRMEERVREAEIQAGEATKQAARQSMRERQMVIERENLLGQLTRSQRNRDSVRADTGLVRSSRKGETTLQYSVKADGGFSHSQKGELTLDQLSGSGKLETLARSGDDR